MAVAQDAAAIFAIKQTNEKVSIWEVNGGGVTLPSQPQGRTKQHLLLNIHIFNVIRLSIFIQYGKI